jgi:hypothetical protein
MMLLRLGTLMALTLLPGCVVVYRAPGSAQSAGQYYAVNTAGYAAPGAPSRTYYRPTTGSAAGSASASADASASASVQPGVPATRQSPRFDRSRPQDRYRPAPVVAPAPRGIVTPQPAPAAAPRGNVDSRPATVLAPTPRGIVTPRPAAPADHRPRTATKPPIVVRRDVVRPTPKPSAPPPARQPGADAYRATAFGLQATNRQAASGSPPVRLRPNGPSPANAERKVDRTSTKPANAQNAKKRRRRAKLK